jgi:hypothetical protein
MKNIKFYVNLVIVMEMNTIYKKYQVVKYNNINNYILISIKKSSSKVIERYISIFLIFNFKCI